MGELSFTYLGISGVRSQTRGLPCVETTFQVKMLPRARIPIIKLSLPPTQGSPFGIACDIGFENRLAIENTRLLLTYAMVDPRLRAMVLFSEFFHFGRIHFNQFSANTDPCK